MRQGNEAEAGFFDMAVTCFYNREKAIEREKGRERECVSERVCEREIE